MMAAAHAATVVGRPINFTTGLPEASGANNDKIVATDNIHLFLVFAACQNIRWTINGK